MNSTTSRARGFTLIEMVIVMIIIAIMGAALTPVISNSLTAYSTVSDNVAVLDKLRYATERLAREIREVNDTDPSENSSFAINMHTSTPQFTRTFQTCTNADCTTSTTNTSTITVGQPSSVTDFACPCVTLTDSSTGAGAQVLVDELNSLAFSYFDKDGDPATVATDVRYVQIDLTLNHTAEGVTQTYAQTTRVGLRNR